MAAGKKRRAEEPMANKRIRNPRAYLSHKRYIAFLAQPSWRNTRKSDPNIEPNPFDVPKLALKGKATRRIRTLAKPKVYGHPRAAPSPERSLKFQRSTTMEPSQYIKDLAVPKKSILLSAQSYGVMLGNQHVVANINAQLKKLKKSKYLKYRMVCNTLASRAAARERKIRRKYFRILKKSDEARNLAEIDKLARPKRKIKPPRPDRGRKWKIDDARLRTLSAPLRRRYRLPAKPGVKPGALIYEITDRMIQLSIPSQRIDPPFNEPGKVDPGALHAVATQRTVELAEPSIREPGEATDLKPEAFGVLPRALKAWCSPRTKKLAEPKKRR